MANPLPDEEAIYEMIKKEKITIPPKVWELINHHIRNDLNRISTGIGSLAFIPSWILKVASVIIRFLYRASFCPGRPPPDLDKLCRSSAGGVKDIKIFGKFLRKLIGI